jgi:hypothetical protein
MGPQVGDVGLQSLDVIGLRCLLGSRVSTWLVPRMVLGVATALLYFTWLLSFSTWGLMWMGYPTACTSHHWHCFIPSHRASQHCSRPPFWVVRGPRDGPPDVVLTARVPNGLNLSWRSPLLPERFYQVPGVGGAVLAPRGLCLEGL